MAKAGNQSNKQPRLSAVLAMLWRTFLFAVACGFLIPIPWVLGWYSRWYVSQFALVGRGAYANA